MGTSFNHAIAGVAWPSSLQQLKFARIFNQAIAGIVWPPSLQELSFEARCSIVVQPNWWGYPPGFSRNLVDLPASLRELLFGDDVDQSIAGVVWPPSLRN